MAMFCTKMTILNNFKQEEESVSQTGQFKQSLESFYVSYSPLSLTNIAEMAMINMKLTIHNDFNLE